jgi:hypothetical protein
MPTKAEIARRLWVMLEERLFNPAKPWPIDNNFALHRQLLAWGLVEETGDGRGTFRTTALGHELAVDYWSVFVGHHALSEIPDKLCDFGLLTRAETDDIIFERWEEGGERLEDILPPILRRLYRAQLRLS